MAKRTDSDSASIHEIFSGEVQYRAPLFQRYYVWESIQLDTLWSDIDSVLDGSANSRFLGAVVLQSFQDRTSTKPQKFWIIDGQQRLTTFYLILIACAHIAHKLEAIDLAGDYIKAYILQQQSRVKGETKLIPTIPDFGQFKEILSFIEEFKPEYPGGNYGKSNGSLVDSFLRNLDEVEKRIIVDEEKSVTELETFVETITNNIEFVQINLADHHDANEVFNRLNDSGQPLEIIDLIRNEVFSLLSDDVKEAEFIYNRHWIDFEKSFDQGDSKKLNKLTQKIRNGYFFPFALIKDHTTKSSEVFKNLSDEWKSKVEDKEAQEGAKYIISDLSQYIDQYLAFTVEDRPTGIGKPLWQVILKFNRMNATSSLLPYTMQLLKEVEKRTVKEEDAILCLNTIESFLVRRAFIGLEPTGLHAVFKNLWSKAKSDPIKLIKNIQTRTVEFPDDDRFSKGIEESELYRRKLCSYVLEEYERSFTKGDVLETFPDITVDHIMPKSRQGDWRKVVSEEIHEKYLNVWANLVPLSSKANAEKQTKSWGDTKDILQKETVFSTTKHLIDKYDKWDIEEIKDRTKTLSKWALKRWPKVSTLKRGR